MSSGGIQGAPERSRFLDSAGYVLVTVAHPAEGHVVLEESDHVEGGQQS